MKWFIDLSMRSKLFISFGLMIVLLAVVVVMAYRELTSIQGLQKKIYEVEFANVADLKDVRFYQEKIRAASITMMIVKDRQRLEALKSLGDELAKKNEEIMRKLFEREKDANHITKLKEFDEIRKSFRETREKQVIPLIFNGKVDEAREVVTGIQGERNEKMAVIIDELVAGAENYAKLAVSESSRSVTSAVNVLTTTGLAAVILGVLAAIYLSRLIAGPMNEIAVTAEKIAGGDLTVTISADNRADEVGVLAQTFKKMIGNMREVNREIQESVSVLASSASEILASTTQVAASVTETATSVTETTATVEEVKQTAQVSSQKAKYVSEAAQKAVQVSQTGGRAVDETVEKMNRIRQQMESVAESIVRLSEHSQAIGDIISTVNDLAEQSNVLAVNAAIEAARGGEHGKGFGVVAQEIRSLAEQSKRATAQVRTILGDIQKATSAAVLATEQGSKAVEAGVAQSSQAGDAIRVLAESITEAAQAATQIVASSQQQFIGMEQITTAMNNIREASEQNITGTKQTESAAHNIHNLGQKLKQLVDQYKV